MRDKTTAALLALFLGGIGAHKFYLGKKEQGYLYLAFFWTFIPAILALVDGIQLLTMSQEQFDVTWNGKRNLEPGWNPAAFPPTYVPPSQNIVVQVAPQGGGSMGHPDVAGQLKSLHELKVAGILTEDEFAAQKKKLLS